MDFLNQLETDNKDDNSIFTFNDKNENNKGGSLPFPFSSQSSVSGGGVGDITFLNDIKSQGGESFTLGQAENENQNNNNNNFGGFDFLNTICEVPESSNNIFNSQSDNGFLSANLVQNENKLDFINEDNEKEDNNFDFAKFQNNNNEEPINVDINNLFKSNKDKKNEIFGKSEESRKNGNFEINNFLNMDTNDKVTKESDNSNNQINPKKNNVKININKNISIISNGNNTNEIKGQTIISNDIDKASNNKNKNKFPPISNTNNNNNINKQIPNKMNNPNSIPNKENIPSSNINVNPSLLSTPSSNTNNSFNMKENKENVPSITNISIKPTTNKPQKVNLDDIDKIISLNAKTNDNKSNIPISNISNNILSLNQNFLQGKQDKIDIGKDNLKYLSNEISNIFNSSLINGKRSEIEPKDKDLQNIDNLLNFTKEKITSKTNKRNPSKSKDKNNKNTYRPLNNPTQYISNNTQNSNPTLIKPLPSDSFDKKSQLIKLSKNEALSLTKIETTSKNMPRGDVKGPHAPSKLEIIQKYNDLAARLNKIREKAKEYRNLGTYFTQLIIANENYNIVYPIVLKKLLEDYNNQTNKLLNLMKIKNNKMTEMNNEFFEEVKKYSLAFPDKK